MSSLILGVCLIASFWTTFLIVRMVNEEHRNAALQWDKERNRLLERIQRPERIPSTEAEQVFEIPEHPPDQWAKVGTIDISDDYGLTDDDG